jgi:hypothetical protein
MQISVKNYVFPCVQQSALVIIFSRDRLIALTRAYFLMTIITARRSQSDSNGLVGDRGTSS